MINTQAYNSATVLYCRISEVSTLKLTGGNKVIWIDYNFG